MGRSSQGKRQETTQLNYNNQRRSQDYTGRDAAISKEQGDIDSLRANPGYTPQDLQASRAEDAQQISSTYGGATDQLKRNAAQTGYGNDAGLFPQISSLADSEGRQAASGANNIALKQADAVLQTRRMLPSLQFQPASLYQTDIGNQTSSNTGLISGRESADSAPPLWANLAQAAIGGGGQVGAAYAGKGGCWIAEALFGENDPRTHLLRSWLNDEFKRTLFGFVVMWVYLRIGRKVAAVARRSRLVRFLLRPLFEMALQSAIRDRSVPCLTQ